MATFSAFSVLRKCFQQSYPQSYPQNMWTIGPEAVWPFDDALLKLLWLAQRDIAKSWTMSLKNWGEIIAALAILWLEKIRL